MAISITMLVLIIWTGFRLVYEGINTPAPRQFWVGAVVYLARWLYLMLRLSWPALMVEARMFRVALALREVHNLRAGKSTDGPQEAEDQNDEDTPPRNYGRIHGTDEKRIRSRDEWEIVLRKGIKKVKDTSRPYWRGYMVSEPVWHSNEQAWDVILLEEGMHKRKLDIFGTTNFIKDDDITEEAYSRFYNLVLTAVATTTTTSTAEPTTSAAKTTTTAAPFTPTGSSSTGQGTSVSAPQSEEASAPQRLQVEVDFAKFEKQWHGLPVQFIANRMKATDTRRIGFIARRIAADAVAYVEGQKTFRTDKQVASLNECLNDAREAQFPALRAVPRGGNR